MKENIWYSESLNIPKNNYIRTIEDPSALKWDSLNQDEISLIIDKILKAYSIVENDYKNYYNEVLIKNEKFTNFKLSGINAKEEILAGNKSASKGLKDTTQTDAILKTIESFDLLSNDIIYVEFGAGKGGLSDKINSYKKGETIHILLEREGVRNKKDKSNENIIRVIIKLNK